MIAAYSSWGLFPLYFKSLRAQPLEVRAVEDARLADPALVQDRQPIAAERGLQ